MSQKVNQDFLRALQSAGWLIKAVDEDKATVSCPRSGCGLNLTYRPGRKIHQSCAKEPTIAECPVRGFDDARVFLRQRREDLALSIKDVEEVAGMAVDHLAKFEKDDSVRIPNAQIFFEWVQALGYQVVLKPAELPVYALRIVAESRDKVAMRKRHFRIRKERRARSAE